MSSYVKALESPGSSLCVSEVSATGFRVSPVATGVPNPGIGIPAENDAVVKIALRR